MNLSPQQINAAVTQINNAFRGGLQLDRDVILAVLEVNGGNVQQTIAFLTAGEGQLVEEAPQANGQPKLPPGYMTKPPNWAQPKTKAQSRDPASLEARTDAVKDLLMSSDASFLEHHARLRAADDGGALYVAVLLLMVEQGVELPQPAKAKILAAVWAHKRWELAAYLLARPNYVFGLPEVLKAVKTLDLPRRIKQFVKKIALLESAGHANAKTLRAIRTRMAEVGREYVDAQVTAVNGSLCKRVKQWVKTIPADHLEFFAIQMPKEPWRELADVCHFSPDDFALKWFLSFVFGKPAPEKSLVVAGANINSSNVKALVETFHIPYSYLRKQVENLSSEVRAMVASYEKLAMVIWYYEELADDSGQVDAVLTSRLAAGEEPELTYGKLMERLLFMKMNNKDFYRHLVPIAERRLKAIKLPLEPPVVVWGDASYSMDVSIRTSTIIASLLTVLSDAEIFFFNTSTFAPPQVPSTVTQVLDVALNTRADGLTANCCAIKRYYDEKIPVRFFIMVTDEIENEPSEGSFFAQLFYRYYTEVHPARLVMVSFLEDPNGKGRMVQALESLGIVPLQFRLDAKRPDLTKLDSLLGLLSAESNFFSLQASALKESLLRGGTVAQCVEQIRQGPAPKKGESTATTAAPSAAASADADKGKEESVVRRFRALDLGADDDVPREFVCPITSEIMEDPVVCADGHTYERAAIEAWLQSHLTSPTTNLPLSVKMLFPNHAIRTSIMEWCAARMKK